MSISPNRHERRKQAAQERHRATDMRRWLTRVQFQNEGTARWYRMLRNGAEAHKRAVARKRKEATAREGIRANVISIK